MLAALKQQRLELSKKKMLKRSLKNDDSMTKEQLKWQENRWKARRRSTWNTWKALREGKDLGEEPARNFTSPIHAVEGNQAGIEVQYYPYGVVLMRGFLSEEETEVIYEETKLGQEKSSSTLQL